MYNPQFGAISNQITQLTLDVLQDLTRHDKYTLDEYIKAVKSDPLAFRCVEIKALRAQNAFGEYQHEDKEVQLFIRNNFKNMNNTVPVLVGQLCSAMPYGFSLAEIIFDDWKLKGFNFLDPRRCKFKGSKGQLEWIIYQNGTNEVWIPYRKCLHIVNSAPNNFNEDKAYGYAETRAALPFIKLKQAMFADMGVSAKTLATGILFGTADSNQTVQQFDKYGNSIGKPKSAVEVLAEQLAGLANHSHLVTDKNNMVTALQVPSGDQFWNLAQQLTKTEILRAYGLNDLIFSEGSAALPTATLGELHFTILDATIKTIVNQIRDQLVEKVVTPLIHWHFGRQRNGYGSFELQTQSDPAQKSMRVNNLIMAISSGILQATDSDVVNAIRQELGLPLKSTEDISYDAMLLQQQQEQMQQPNDSQDSSMAYP